MLAAQAQTKTTAPAKTYTLEELQEMKADWIQDAEREKLMQELLIGQEV